MLDHGRQVKRGPAFDRGIKHRHSEGNRHRREGSAPDRPPGRLRQLPPEVDGHPERQDDCNNHGRYSNPYALSIDAARTYRSSRLSTRPIGCGSAASFVRAPRVGYVMVLHSVSRIIFRDRAISRSLIFLAAAIDHASYSLRPHRLARNRSRASCRLEPSAHPRHRSTGRAGVMGQRKLNRGRTERPGAEATTLALPRPILAVTSPLA